jgi:tetratricopeptide (TPR) repeat protein
MTNKTAIVMLLSSVIVLGVMAANKARVRPAPENHPASCRLVLAPLPVDKPIDQEIARAQARVVNSPSSASALERLGWTFIKKARVSFDAGFYKLAEQCAVCMEARSSKSADSLLLHAHALQSLHRFGEAEIAARELVNMRERPFDYGVLGDILIDQGKVREGAAAYQKMVDLRPDLQSYARGAHVRWLTGNLDGAIQLMKLATSASSPNDPEAAAWAFTRLANYQFQHNATKSALESCAAALALQSDYAPAMFVRGRVLLAEDRVNDAVEELQRAARLNPLPEYQWALADALAAAGNRNRAVEIESQIAEAADDPRAVSLFLATRHQDVERAMRLAQQDLSNRQDIFTHDALAWALAAAGRSTEAQQQVGQALAEDTADSRLYLHAGIIAALNNDNKKAKRWLDQASASKQTLLPSERAQLEAWRAKMVRE